MTMRTPNTDAYTKLVKGSKAYANFKMEMDVLKKYGVEPANEHLAIAANGIIAEVGTRGQKEAHAVVESAIKELFAAPDAE